MRKIIAFTCLFLIYYGTISAQPGKKKGSGSTPGGASATTTSSAPAGASSPAANTGSQQTGYVYRLRKKYHIFYYSVKDELILVARDPNIPQGKVLSTLYVKRRKIECGRIFGVTDSQQPIKQVQRFDPCTFDPNRAAMLIPDKFHLERSDTICVPAVCTPSDSLFKLVNRTVDSLSRYVVNGKWAISNLWNSRRLRVAVTQLDSGKLQVAIYDNNFSTKMDAENFRKIAYTEIGVKDHMVPDYAIPISQEDSAQNFYLQVNNKIFANDPLTFIKLPYSLTQVGAMTIPFKYRRPPHGVNIYNKNPQTPGDTVIAAPSESTGSINLSLYLGRKWGWTKFYFDPSKTKNTLSYMASVFAGPALITLSNTNVAYPKSIDSLPSQAIAFSFGGSITAEWKGIDFGLFGGADYTSKSYHWIYNRKFWLGFGIGVNLSMFTSGPTQLQL